MVSATLYSLASIVLAGVAFAVCKARCVGRQQTDALEHAVDGQDEETDDGDEEAGTFADDRP